MTNTDINALKILDALAKSANADHQEIAKRCEDLMEGRVDMLQKDHGITRSQAYAEASSSDELFKQAYRVSVESQNRAVAVQRMGDRLGAHI